MVDANSSLLPPTVPLFSFQAGMRRMLGGLRCAAREFRANRGAEANGGKQLSGSLRLACVWTSRVPQCNCGIAPRSSDLKA